jgi:hypothetical protein
MGNQGKGSFGVPFLFAWMAWDGFAGLDSLASFPVL